jgi:hypothetical protein
MIRFILPRMVAAVGLLLAYAGFQPCRAEVILGPAPVGTIPSYYYRFSSTYTDNPTQTVNNATFYQTQPLIANLDLSGVGWKLPGIFGAGGGTGYNVTMIDSTHFISNWHVNAPGGIMLGDTINFRPAGTSSIVTRTVANLQQVPNLGLAASGVPDGSPSDVMLGTLSAPLGPGSGIAAYPIATVGTVQEGVYLYGRESALGQNNISPNGPGSTSPLVLADVGTGTTVTFRMDYDQPNSNPDGLSSTVGSAEAHFNAGDSGGPTFVLVGSQLQLLGGNMFIQSYGDTGEPPLPSGVSDPVEYSGSTYLPFYTAQINTLIAVPEPSSLALCAFAAAGSVGGYIRSRRRRPTPV